MRYVRKVKETVERDVLESTVCDMCGAQTKGDEWGGDYEWKETEVRFRDGVSYPGDSSGRVYEWDICPECFMGPLAEFIKAQRGNRPREREYG